MKKIFLIYKSSREDELYLYVDHQEKLSRVPKPLMEHFGTPKLVTTMIITPKKKLARADSTKVISEVKEKGYYLQMPPSKIEPMVKVDPNKRRQKK